MSQMELSLVGIERQLSDHARMMLHQVQLMGSCLDIKLHSLITKRLLEIHRQAQSWCGYQVWVKWSKLLMRSSAKQSLSLKLMASLCGTRHLRLAFQRLLNLRLHWATSLIWLTVLMAKRMVHHESSTSPLIIRYEAYGATKKTLLV